MLRARWPWRRQVEALEDELDDRDEEIGDLREELAKIKEAVSH